MNRAFGVEIEMTGMRQEQARNILQLIGIAVRGEGRESGTRTWWKIVLDGSVSDGFEVVSPILRGQEGLEELKTVICALDDAGGKVDRRCGLHVHLNARELSLIEMKTVIQRYARFESEIDAFMPPSRRGNSNTYCNSMLTFVQSDRFQNADTISRLIAAQPDRYYKVNLKAYPRQGSMEFRQHSGSINALKIGNWVRFIDGFVQESCRIATGGEAPTPPAEAPNFSGLQPKMATLANLLMQHSQGISSGTLQSALGVQAHSLRANLTYLRRSGFQIDGHRENGETIYRLISAPQEQTTGAHAPGATGDGGLFSGIAEDIARFYRNRAIVLNARRT